MRRGTKPPSTPSFQDRTRAWYVQMRTEATKSQFSKVLAILLVKPEVNNVLREQCRPLLMLYSCACIHVYKHTKATVSYIHWFYFH